MQERHTKHEASSAIPDPEDVKDSILREPGMLPCSDDYRSLIANEILEDVIGDLMTSADPVLWNDDDIRMAVGRVLMERLGIIS